MARDISKEIQPYRPATTIHAFMKRMAVPRIGDSAILICLGKPATNHQIRRDNGHFRSSCR
ncbi:hypothetical protein RHECNPAF_33400113 [Rhizobium etli CNPAF512]|nr:hypothetical protein RHECNPAF_33400113 [Rhizobium etli CNPAF512]